MRIISQDKMKDIPYENFIIKIEKMTFVKYEIFAECIYGNNSVLLGRYPSEEKAIEVMHQIRNAERVKNSFFNMP